MRAYGCPSGKCAGEVADQLDQLLGEVVGGEGAGRAPQRAGGELVGAGRPADAEVDAARVQRLEHAELLGDHERGVVGQHDAARPEADRLTVTPAAWASSTGGDELAMPGMLWCSATQ